MKMIIGLGNPGAQYALTRHNAGFWFVDRLAQQLGIEFRLEKKFQAEVGSGLCHGEKIYLVKPTTFMNHSGRCVLAVKNYFTVANNDLLLAYDDLDLPPGTVKLKFSGGHGGHNGLRDTVPLIGADFHRLRIGIGHPGHKSAVVKWVLSRASAADEDDIFAAIDRALELVPLMMSGQWQQATQQLHSNNPQIESR